MTLRRAATLSLVLAVACSGPEVDDVAPASPDPSIALVPAGERVPLSFRLQVDAPEPVRVVASWGGATVDFGEAALTHDLPLHGFRPEASTPVEVRLVGEAGAAAVFELDAVTGPLPSTFPDVALLAHQRERMQPGLTLLSIRPAQDRLGVNDEGFLIALADDGEVVWALQHQQEPVIDAVQLDDGALLARIVDLGAPGDLLARMDLTGEVQTRWHGRTSAHDDVEVDVPGFHHEVRPTSHGTLLSLTKEWLDLPYPTSYTDPDALEVATLVTDVAVEFDLQGTILRRWHVGDHVDSGRISFGALTPNTAGGFDWTHGNAAVEDPDGDIVVSLRNQSALLKFRRDGQLAWILGDPARWPAALQPFLLAPSDPEMRWFYHQHAPDPHGDGRIVLFDNGGERAIPFTGVPPLPPIERYSRVVAYQIDEAAQAVTELWSLDETTTGRVHSPYLGDAEVLPNGNVLACFGYVASFEGVPLAASGLGARAVRLVELVQGDLPEIVWEVQVSTAADRNPHGVTAYRAQRIAGFYPHLSR